MRPKIKDDAQRVSLTLSAPKREILMRLALARGVSRTQIIEDLLQEATESQRAGIVEGNIVPQPHNGGDVRITLNPCDGGSNPTLIRYQTAVKGKSLT